MGEVIDWLRRRCWAAGCRLLILAASGRPPGLAAWATVRDVGNGDILLAQVGERATTRHLEMLIAQRLGEEG